MPAKRELTMRQILQMLRLAGVGGKKNPDSQTIAARISEADLECIALRADREAAETRASRRASRLMTLA